MHKQNMVFILVDYLLVNLNKVKIIFAIVSLKHIVFYYFYCIINFVIKFTRFIDFTDFNIIIHTNYIIMNLVIHTSIVFILSNDFLVDVWCSYFNNYKLKNKLYLLKLLFKLFLLMLFIHLLLFVIFNLFFFSNLPFF